MTSVISRQILGQFSRLGRILLVTEERKGLVEVAGSVGAVPSFEVFSSLVDTSEQLTCHERIPLSNSSSLIATTFLSGPEDLSLRFCGDKVGGGLSKEWVLTGEELTGHSVPVPKIWWELNVSSYLTRRIVW
jgi:hypothetical protein